MDFIKYPKNKRLKCRHTNSGNIFIFKCVHDTITERFAFSDTSRPYEKIRSSEWMQERFIIEGVQEKNQEPIPMFKMHENVMAYGIKGIILNVNTYDNRTGEFLPNATYALKIEGQSELSIVDESEIKFIGEK